MWSWRPGCSRQCHSKQPTATQRDTQRTTQHATTHHNTPRHTKPTRTAPHHTKRIVMVVTRGKLALTSLSSKDSPPAPQPSYAALTSCSPLRFCVSAQVYTRAPVHLPPQALIVLSVAKGGLQYARRAHPDTDGWQPHREGIGSASYLEASGIQ